METDKSIFDKQFKPYYQALFVLLIYIIILLIVGLLKYLDWITFTSIDYWKYATAVVLFFIMVNCVYCFPAKEKMIYYRDSILTYTLVLIVFSIASKFFSGMNISEAESYSWIWMVFSIIYIVLITIINLLRKIVEVAIKQDQNLTNEK
jgi:hypothetical protein